MTRWKKYSSKYTMSSPQVHMNSTENVILQSSEGKYFQVSRAVIDRSTLIKNMIEDIGEVSETPIPLPNVTSKVLEKVIEYCEHHKNDPILKTDEEYKDKHSKDIRGWDSDFINIDQDQLCEIVLAANYLDIKDLLYFGCKAIADFVKKQIARRNCKVFLT